MPFTTRRTRRLSRARRDRGGPGRAARRRESAGTVAIVADEAGFARMRRYPTFTHTDHAGYLRWAEDLLRSLAGSHGHTSVALFDPSGFADYCARAGLDQDSPASRARYTAEVAARGATVPYEGQPIERLVPDLLAAHLRQESWELGTDLLAAAGDCAGCAAPLARCAFERAASLLTTAVGRAAPGTHHLVASLMTGPGPLTAVLDALVAADGAVRVPEHDALVMCTVLAAGLATGDPGGLVLRSVPSATPGREHVRGWSLRDGRLRALTEAEVFAAYCTDARTGEPVPPEPGVTYGTAPTIPVPPCPPGTRDRP